MIGAQCRMARAALQWTVRELAEKAAISHDTVVRIEAGEEVKPSTIAKVRTAFESASVEFTNGGQPGVRLKAVIVFGVIGAESGEPCLKGYDKAKIVIVGIDRGVFPRDGSSPLRHEIAKAQIGKLNEIANRKYAEWQKTGDRETLVISETDIDLSRDVGLG